DMKFKETAKCRISTGWMGLGTNSLFAIANCLVVYLDINSVIVKITTVLIITNIAID
ncbi:8160_t:CDS:1, partial [Gigaspora rosea]